MNRKECNDKDQVKYLDKVNEERLETTRKRVARAVRILKPATWRTYETDEEKAQLKTDIAHATNLLEAGADEMQFHCNWFDYDSGVVFQINEACGKLGQALADMFDEEHDIEMVTADVADAIVLLAKALATLVCWNDADQDVSEV